MLLTYWDLTQQERKDVADWEGAEEEDYVRYKGWVYNLSEFMWCPPGVLEGWDGYQNDTFFSGILVKWAKEDSYCDGVIMGWFYS